MKKIATIFCVLFFSITFMACGTNNTGPHTSENDDNKIDIQGGNVLVVYFSRTGTTKTLAENINKTTGGDLFEIVPVTPYSTDYNTCLSQASSELSANARPPLATHVANMDNYDVIFVGYPIWHGQTPMVIRTFLEEYDFSGKTVIPFCTSASSGFGSSMNTVEVMCPDSTVSKSYTRGVNITTWLTALGIVQ
jgi:flavodoxin